MINIEIQIICKTEIEGGNTETSVLVPMDASMMDVASAIELCQKNLQTIVLSYCEKKNLSLDDESLEVFLKTTKFQEIYEGAGFLIKK